MNNLSKNNATANATIMQQLKKSLVALLLLYFSFFHPFILSFSSLRQKLLLQSEIPPRARLRT